MLKEFRSIDVYWDKATSRIYGEIRSSSSDEKGRKLTVQIVNDGQIQDLTNADLNLYWETQDGENKGLDPFIALDPENGIYELYFRRGMLQHVGKLNAHLRLVDTTGAITSEPFTIFVFEGFDVDAMANEDELSALNQALIEVQNIKQDEAERVSAETERITAEEERKTAETARATAETTRNTNETTRVSNETDRVNAEDTRNTNETNRVDAESGRVTAETARVIAEEEREQGYPALDGRITAHMAESSLKHITESGSNDDGYYIKFDDGTMICRPISPVVLTFSETSVLLYKWIFPETFISNQDFTCIPNISLPSNVQARGVSYPYTGTFGSSEATLRLYSGTVNFNSGDTAGARPIAIGRWK